MLSLSAPASSCYQKAAELLHKLQYGCIVTYLLLVVSVTVICAVIALSLRHEKVWGEDWPNPNPDARCERAQPRGWIAQPMNSFSNLIYFYIGLHIFFLGVYDFLLWRWRTFENEHGNSHQLNKVSGVCAPADCETRALALDGILPFSNLTQNLLTNVPSFSLLLGLQLISLSYGSFYYHACNCCEYGKQLDMAALLSVMMFPVFMGLFCVFPRVCNRSSHYLWVSCDWVFTVVAIEWKKIFLFFNAQWVWLFVMFFSLLIFETFLVSLSYIRVRRMYHMTYPIFVLLSVAGICVAVIAWFEEDVMGRCIIAKRSYFQPLHAIWHLGTAASIWFYYSFFRTLNSSCAWKALFWDTRKYGSAYVYSALATIAVHMLLVLAFYGRSAFTLSEFNERDNNS